MTNSRGKCIIRLSVALEANFHQYEISNFAKKGKGKQA